MHCPQVCSHDLSASGAVVRIQWSRKHQWSTVQFPKAEAPQLLLLVCLPNFYTQWVTAPSPIRRWRPGIPAFVMMIACANADPSLRSRRASIDLCCTPTNGWAVSRSLEAPGAVPFGISPPDACEMCGVKHTTLPSLARSLPLAHEGARRPPPAKSLPLTTECTPSSPPSAANLSVVHAACQLLERAVSECCDEPSSPELVFAPIFHSVSVPGISGGDYLRQHLLRLGLARKEHLAEAVVLHAFLLIDRLLHTQSNNGARLPTAC